jgi:hypothetical protein
VLILALAVAMATAGPQPDSRASASSPAIQATATVRIVSGARISATELPDEALVRDTWVTGPDGVQHKARLVEFP